MDVGLGRHRHEEGEIIHTRGNVREDAAHPAPTFTVLFPIPRRLHQVARGAGCGFDAFAGIELLSAAFDEFGLVIKRVALAGAAVHEELHDAFDLGAMMQTAVQVGAGFGYGRLRQQPVLAEQMGERDAAEATAQTPQKFAARQRMKAGRIFRHGNSVSSQT